MASHISIRRNGYGPYSYIVTYTNGVPNWEYLGRTDATDGDAYIKNGHLSNRGREELDIPDDDRKTTPTPTASGTIDTSLVDDDVAVAADELDDDEIESLIDEDVDGRNLLYKLKNAAPDYPPDDQRKLESLIDEVTDYETENPELTRDAADELEDILGFRPFELTLTERDDPYRDAWDVGIDVDDTLLTENAELNALLLDDATGTRAEMPSGHQRRAKHYADILGEDRMRAVKQRIVDETGDSYGLGFVLKEHVPSGGNGAPITELPYVGPATAEKMHPDGGTMSIEDVETMSDHEWERVEFADAINREDYAAEHGDEIASIVLEETKNAGDGLGRMLGMDEVKGRSYSRGMWYRDGGIGVVPTDEGAEMFDIISDNDVVDVDKSGELVTVTAADGGEGKFRHGYWNIIETITKYTGNDVKTGDGGPARVDLPDGTAFAVAPVE